MNDEKAKLDALLAERARLDSQIATKRKLIELIEAETSLKDCERETVFVLYRLAVSARYGDGINYVDKRHFKSRSEAEARNAEYNSKHALDEGPSRYVVKVYVPQGEIVNVYKDVL